MLLPEEMGYLSEKNLRAKNKLPLYKVFTSEILEVPKTKQVTALALSLSNITR